MIQIIAAVIFGIMSLLSTGYCQTPAINSGVLIEFVRNWQELKQHTPEVLHEQLDDLYLQYVQQRANLNLDEQEATLLLNKIFVECMKEHVEKFEDVALAAD